MASTKMPTRWIQTSDGFIPAPDDQQPKTLLHKQVLDAVDEFRISSFDAFAMRLIVTAGSKFDIVAFKSEPDPTTFKFEIDPHGDRTRTLSTRFHNNQVQVFLNDKWTVMKDYLEVESRYNAERPGIRVQREWWSANKKHFPLFSLSAELRAEIYRQAAPAYAIEPYALDRGRGRTLPRVKFGNDMVSELLKCNKVVAQEMRNYMFLHLPLLINHHYLLSRTLRSNVCFPFKQLTRLTLALPTHKDYLELFGLRARSTSTGDTLDVRGRPSTAWGLCRIWLTNLKKLEIVIPSRETLNNLPSFANGCQTKTAQILLEIMWPYVRGHPLVISGMVKRWQKKSWEAKAAQEHEEYEWLMADVEDGGVPVTQEDLDRYEGKDRDPDNKNEGSHDGADTRSRYDSDSDSDCDSDSDSNSDSDSYDGDGDFEYHLPLKCECHRPCLKGGWTDRDYVKDKEGGEEPADDYEFASDFESDDDDDEDD